MLYFLFLILWHFYIKMLRSFWWFLLLSVSFLFWMLQALIAPDYPWFPMSMIVFGIFKYNNSSQYLSLLAIAVNGMHCHLSVKGIDIQLPLWVISFSYLRNLEVHFFFFFLGLVPFWFFDTIVQPAGCIGELGIDCQIFLLFRRKFVVDSIQMWRFIFKNLIIIIMWENYIFVLLYLYFIFLIYVKCFIWYVPLAQFLSLSLSCSSMMKLVMASLS